MYFAVNGSNFPSGISLHPSIETLALRQTHRIEDQSVKQFSLSISFTLHYLKLMTDSSLHSLKPTRPIIYSLDLIFIKPGARQWAWLADGKDAPFADWRRRALRHAHRGSDFFFFRDSRLEVPRHLSGRLLLHTSGCDAAAGCVCGHGRALSLILGG